MLICAVTVAKIAISPAKKNEEYFIPDILILI
jgi:hypothetical protein